MTVIWGTNYALVKSAFQELDPQAFNALRLIEASAVMVATNVIVSRRRSRVPERGSRPASPLRADEIASIFHTPAPVTRADWIRLAWLGLIGHCLYQYLFVGGLAKTSVANGALLVSATPVVITLLSSLSGKERIGALALGRHAALAHRHLHRRRARRARHRSVACAATRCSSAPSCAGRSTRLARGPLMVRHSPVGVTALSMLIGTLVYVPIAAPALGRVAWSAVSIVTWVKLVYSSLFAICIAYTIWYAAVREIGSARTSVYSNLLPIVAMITAYVWLREPIGPVKVAGAAAVLAGVALTRMGQQRLQIPAE